MRINLAAIPPPEPGQSAVEEFQTSLDLSGLRRFGERPFPQPVTVRGQVRQQHGEWTVRYRADYRLSQTCARCLGPAETDAVLEREHPVSIREEDLPDAVISAPGGVLDLEELVSADLSLSLEGVALCREDCLGLCPVCGANRNETPCGCSQEKPTDPRFDALKKLLEEQ